MCKPSCNALYCYLKHLQRNMTVGSAFFKTEWQNKKAETSYNTAIEITIFIIYPTNLKDVKKLSTVNDAHMSLAYRVSLGFCHVSVANENLWPYLLFLVRFHSAYCYRISKHSCTCIFLENTVQTNCKYFELPNSFKINCWT